MSRVSRLTRKAVIVCPRCGGQADADPIQLQGKCSLICPYCGFHFYITPKVNGIAQVWEGERAKLIK